MNLPPVIKYSESDRVFIEANSSTMDNQWYIIPVVFEKLGDNLFRQWLPENLPDEIKEAIKPIFPDLKIKSK